MTFFTQIKKVVKFLHPQPSVTHFVFLPFLPCSSLYICQAENLVPWPHFDLVDEVSPDYLWGHWGCAVCLGRVGHPSSDPGSPRDEVDSLGRGSQRAGLCRATSRAALLLSGCVCHSGYITTPNRKTGSLLLALAVSLAGCWNQERL